MDIGGRIVGAAPNYLLSIEDLVEAIGMQWRGQVVLKDIGLGASFKKMGKDPVIGISDDTDPTNLLRLAINQNLNHVCQVQNLKIERELNTSASMILNPENFIKFPISTILSPLESGVSKEKELTHFNFSFSQSGEKIKALGSLNNELRKSINSESLRSDIHIIADELFTNAVYNAPLVGGDNKKLKIKARTATNVSMDKGSSANLFLGFDESQLVIGCKDPFGSLRLQTLLPRILECYEKGVADSMRQGPGGAGIGSYMVYNASASYYVGIIRGQATVLCCSMPLKMSSRKRSQIPKNLHFFEINGGHK